jgi:hypothetical protein
MLLSLDPTGDWHKEYLELTDKDNRGPGKELYEQVLRFYLLFSTFHPQTQVHKHHIHFKTLARLHASHIPYLILILHLFLLITHFISRRSHSFIKGRQKEHLQYRARLPTRHRNPLPLILVEDLLLPTIRRTPEIPYRNQTMRMVLRQLREP